MLKDAMAMLLISFGNANNAGPSEAGKELYTPKTGPETPTSDTRDKNDT